MKLLGCLVLRWRGREVPAVEEDKEKGLQDGYAWMNIFQVTGNDVTTLFLLCFSSVTYTASYLSKSFP